MHDSTDNEYGGCVYPNAYAATVAALFDWATAGGNNTLEFAIEGLTTQDGIDELNECGWFDDYNVELTDPAVADAVGMLRAELKEQD